MTRNRLALRLALIAVAAAIFFTRGGQHSRQFVWGFSAALALAVIMTIIRAVIDKKRQEAARQSRIPAESKNVELFTKPKDF